MRATALKGAAAGLTSLALTAVAVTPAGSAPLSSPEAAHQTAQRTAAEAAGWAEAAGVEIAAAHAAVSGVDFGSCHKDEKLPATVECGAVTVPLDYADPAGEQIELTVSRITARGEPAEHQGALVYNPGGPGASSMYFPLLGGLKEWKGIAQAYDLVGYAPRGVARSAPLSCQDPADFAKAPTQAPSHPSPSYKKERIAEAKAYARGCAHRNGPALRHYHSLNNARDLEVLRAALGERKLTFMGASYGTYVGALYATLYPSRVHRMVFDSAVDPDPRQIWYHNNLDQSLAFEARWADFRTWTARHDDVYGLGSTAEEVARSYEKVRARLAYRPAGGTVGPGQLHAAMLGVAYYDDYWPRRATALSEFLKGNDERLIEQAAPKAETAKARENGNAVYTAIECNDASWPTQWEVWDRDNSELALKAPFETWDNAWMNLPCAYWSEPRQRPLDVGAGEGELPPTLILAAERDAATPYAGALELQRRLAGSALVTELGAGTHGIGGGANACVNAHMERYLLTGKTPERRAACAPHPVPDPVSLEQHAETGRVPRAV
ncbi:alpha/beta hydrolase [Streptomyces sp. HNM0663]|uniref:Alpha/beta hydrolase n=1 Tax=Streptomyces chengmaiensis TaxID=3040919 RepID=A0ABT6HRZ6_9ACTN|nr:alpha/beta hydrolase [Streptomyces chengmaiensis]MDH2391082.1 alpha/beta hydrolase [Streptomyces chengmaiensis]